MNVLPAVAVLVLSVNGCGSGKPTAATQTQTGAPHRRFEIKFIDVFNNSTMLDESGKKAELEAYPQSAVELACADGWEPYAVERVNNGFFDVHKYYIRYYLKREMP